MADIQQQKIFIDNGTRVILAIAAVVGALITNNVIAGKRKVIQDETQKKLDRREDAIYKLERKVKRVEDELKEKTDEIGKREKIIDEYLDMRSNEKEEIEYLHRFGRRESYKFKVADGLLKQQIANNQEKLSEYDKKLLFAEAKADEDVEKLSQLDSNDINLTNVDNYSDKATLS